MKIAFSGPSNAGKTTAIKTIQEMYSDAVIVHHELIRNHIGEYPSIDYVRKEMPYTYLDILDKVISEKIQQEDSADDSKIHIFDRSLADSLYYLTSYTANEARTHRYYQVLNSVLDACKPDRYDAILFFKGLPINQIDLARPYLLDQAQRFEQIAIKALNNQLFNNVLQTSAVDNQYIIDFQRLIKNYE